MNLSSSIFRKPCPACATSASVNATRCDCGHVFESSTHSLSPLEATLRDEELYENYLAARAEQARRAASTAQEALTGNPDDPELASAATLANEVAMSIDNDLAEQRNKIAGIRNAIQKMELGALPNLTEPSTVPKIPAAPRPTVSPSAPIQTVLVSDTTPDLAASAIKPARSNSTNSVRVPVWHAIATQKATAVLAALKKAKARETVVPAQTRVTAAEYAEQTTQPSAPPPPQKKSVAINTPSTVSPSAFRKEQAAKAEKIMEARKAEDSKVCPNCTSDVPIATTRCGCGFGFVSSGTELPSLTLCTGDFTALRNSLKLNLR